MVYTITIFHEQLGLLIASTARYTMTVINNLGSYSVCEIDGMNDLSCLYRFELSNMLSVSHFDTRISGTDLFPVPFCICFQASAHEIYSTALLFPVLTGSNHHIPL